MTFAFGLLIGGTTSADVQEQVHTVIRGDTLSGLALQYDTTVETLVTVNNIRDANLIYVGDRLVVAGFGGSTASTESRLRADSRPVAVETGGTLREQFRAAVRASRWPSWTWDTLEVIARCESGFNPRAVGRAGEVGVLQIHPIHRGLHSRYNLYDMNQNIDAAYTIFAEAGYSWRPWQATVRGC